MAAIYDSRNYQVLIDRKTYRHTTFEIYDSRNYQVLIDYIFTIFAVQKSTIVEIIKSL